MVTVPLIEIASIGTQITEAFAGLDRIREIKRMTTEDEDESRSRTVSRDYWRDCFRGCQL